jgi:Sec-independent protein secretion pathway component TatC
MCLLYEMGLFVARYITPREKGEVATPPSEPA